MIGYKQKFEFYDILGKIKINGLRSKSLNNLIKIYTFLNMFFILNYCII